MKNAGNTLSKILTYILALLLVLVAMGAVVMIIEKTTATSGMYIVYAETEYTEDNASDGIAIEWQGDSYAAKFNISNTEDWGIYSVDSCSVKVIPNYTDSNNFTFDINSKSYAYSKVSDMSAAFAEDYTAYDGTGIPVDEDGNFTLYFDVYYTSAYIDTAMNTALSRVYGSDVELSSAADISSYPYFALQVTSPDNSTVVTIPFVICGEYEIITAYSITYNLTNCYVDDTAPVTINSDETATVTIYADNGYQFSGTYVVAGCSSESVASTSAYRTLTLYDCIGDITISMKCTATEETSGYTVSGIWYFAEDCSAYASSYLSSNPIENVNFTSNGLDFTYLSITSNYIYYQGYLAYDFVNGGWQNESYRYIDFGSGEQSVSEWFYNYLNHYAAYVDTETAYTVNISSDSNQYIDTVIPYITKYVAGYLSYGDTMTVTITALSNYIIYAVGVDNAAIDSKDLGDTTAGGNTVTIVISNPIDTVTITVLAIDA